MGRSNRAPRRNVVMLPRRAGMSSWAAAWAISWALKCANPKHLNLTTHVIGYARKLGTRLRVIMVKR